jgi:hypothetical protein
MLYNNTLPNRSQQYLIAARQWISEINFFTREAAFLQNLLQGCIPMLSDKTFAEKVARFAAPNIMIGNFLKRVLL